MATGDLYSVNVNIVVRDTNNQMVFHFEEVTPGSTEVDATIVSESWLTQYIAPLIAVMSDEAVVTRILARKLWASRALPGRTFPVTGEGLRAGDPIVQSNAALIQLFQTAGTSRNHGKKFVPGIREIDCNGNEWASGAFQALLDTLATSWTANLPEASGPGIWRPVVISKTETPPVFPGGKPLPVTGAVASPIVSRMRSRQTEAYEHS